ncbi:unnamed protein product [Cylindrotheca closterium]|uniref:Uncharacterized protein n=1 Tax=Cylindrotheca closterium TaxID=2856 RepID=A0AAD2JMA2_9STRA|nr:unnamed protein product [Cylindrotheca closterium]
MTVAEEKTHPVTESAIIDFVRACNEIGKAMPDATAEPMLWFVQPEDSLDYTRFVNLQPLETHRELSSYEDDSSSRRVQMPTNKREI